MSKQTKSLRVAQVRTKLLLFCCKRTPKKCHGLFNDLGTENVFESQLYSIR